MKQTVAEQLAVQAEANRRLFPLMTALLATLEPHFGKCTVRYVKEGDNVRGAPQDLTYSLTADQYLKPWPESIRVTKERIAAEYKAMRAKEKKGKR